MEVDTTTGAVQVTRVVVAHDCGLIVNPNELRNQIEGNVIQATSRTLMEEVQFDQGGVTSLYWDTSRFIRASSTRSCDLTRCRTWRSRLSTGRPSQPGARENR
ncbi:MAG: molybdopterin cofactor-binding domain-containing protein [Trebonia sp.]